MVTLGLGKKVVHCPVRVANLEDCIVGLDVLRALDCVINTRGGTHTFPDGQVVHVGVAADYFTCGLRRTACQTMRRGP